MAVFAPGDSPPAGGDQGGFLSWLQGLAPDAQSAIMRVMNQANPIQPAAADTLSQAPNPLNNPTPAPAALQGGGPPVPPALTSANRVNYPIGGGPGNAMQAPTGTPNPTPWFPSGSNTPTMAIPSAGAPLPPVRPEAIARVQPATNINPQATALAPAAAPAAGSSPFIKLDYRPNADPGTGGGMLGGALASPRGQGGAPIATALDLSHLFGGGQPAAAARPAAAAPIGSSPGMRIINGPAATPPGRTQMTPDQLSAAVSKPGWWKGLGNKDMTPDQLARAVRKPNWYQNV